jgi:hypothetical protein
MHSERGNLLISYQDSEIGTFAVNGKILSVVTFPKLYYLKLIGIEFVQESDRDTHQAIIISGDILCFVDI